MTLLDIRPTLVASHIKPWVVSNNEERCDACFITN